LGFNQQEREKQVTEHNDKERQFLPSVRDQDFPKFPKCEVIEIPLYTKIKRHKTDKRIPYSACLS